MQVAGIGSIAGILGLENRIDNTSLFAYKFRA
jgi:hypothetical protein